jgi:hypothetical protein
MDTERVTILNTKKVGHWAVEIELCQLCGGLGGRIGCFALLSLQLIVAHSLLYSACSQLARDKLFLHGEKARHCRKHLAHAVSGEHGFPALRPGRSLFTRSRSPSSRRRSSSRHRSSDHLESPPTAILPGPSSEGDLETPTILKFVSTTSPAGPATTHHDGMLSRVAHHPSIA